MRMRCPSLAAVEGEAHKLLLVPTHVHAQQRLCSLQKALQISQALCDRCSCGPVFMIAESPRVPTTDKKKIGKGKLVLE